MKDSIYQANQYFQENILFFLKKYQLKSTTPSENSGSLH